MATVATVDEYIAGFPPEVAERLRRVRHEIVSAVADATGQAPEEKMRYGIAAVMLGGRYALHFAGWKKHIGLYPVPALPDELERETAPHRAEKDSVVFPHARALPFDLVGRIARQQGALNEAIHHFERVVQLDPAHGQHEIWRETALVYYDAGQYSDALQMLDKFLDKRPSDAEARYWRGMTLHNLNRENEAMREMQSCIESVRVAPAYKYRADRRWMDLAQSFLNDRR